MEVSAWTQNWRKENRKLNPFCNFLIETFEREIIKADLVVRNRLQFSASQLSESFRAETRKSRSFQKLRQDQNENKSRYRFQSTVRSSTFAVLSTHFNKVPEAIRIYTTANFTFLFSHEDPEIFIIVRAGSQQKFEMVFWWKSFH